MKLTYASVAEVIRLDNVHSSLKKKRVEITCINHEEETVLIAHQLYQEACKLEIDKQWEAAFRKMREAARVDSPEANFDLYVMYRIGRGCKPNMKKSVACCKKAADQGYPPALNSMGMMHELGESEFVEKDLDKAIDFYVAAMNKGDTTALDNLERILKDEE